MAHTTGNSWALDMGGTSWGACKIISWSSGSNDMPQVDDNCGDTRGPSRYLPPDNYEVAPIEMRCSFETEATPAMPAGPLVFPDGLKYYLPVQAGSEPAGYVGQEFTATITMPIKNQSNTVPASITGTAWISSFTFFDTAENNTRVEGSFALQFKEGYTFTPESAA